MYSLEVFSTRLLSFWMFSISSFVFFYLFYYTSFLSNPLFQVGPNSHLFILYIPINTNKKYFIVVSFCFLNSIFRSVNHNILQSWIINEIQDVGKNNPDINSFFCYEIACVSSIFNWFDFFMYMHILMSQIDLFIIEIFADIFITIIITKYYLNKKKYHYTFLG